MAGLCSLSLSLSLSSRTFYDAPAKTTVHGDKLICIQFELLKVKEAGNPMYAYEHMPGIPPNIALTMHHVTPPVLPCQTEADGCKTEARQRSGIQSDSASQK